MITLSTTAHQDPIPVLVKVREVSKILNISRNSVHHLIESGDLEASHVTPSNRNKRQHVRITRKSLCKFYKQRFGHALNRALENPFTA